MSTIIVPSDAEYVVKRWTDTDLWASLHTSNPGLTGAFEVAVNRVFIPGETGWNEFEDYLVDQGRLQTNADTLAFDGAPEALMYEWIGLWTAASEGTFRGACRLHNPADVEVGETVSFPPGTLRIISVGVAAPDEDEFDFEGE